MGVNKPSFSSLNDLNLPPYPFIVLNTMAVIQPNEKYSPQSPDPSNQSSSSTCPMYVSTTEGWQTPHTTTDDSTFYPEDEPRRVYWDISSGDTFDSNEPRPVSFISSPSTTPPSPRRQTRKLSKGCLFLKTGECHSTPARHAASPYKSERHPIAQIELKTLVLLLKL